MNLTNLLKLSPVVLGLTFVGTASAQGLPAGPAKATMEKVCSACHGPDIVVGMKNTKEAWQGIVDTMKGRGAAGSDADFTAIVNYLAANFGAAPAGPAAGGGRAGAAPAAFATQKGRPKLFVREEWKQTGKGGEHPMGTDNLEIL
jgi:cytochrome c5